MFALPVFMMLLYLLMELGGWQLSEEYQLGSRQLVDIRAVCRQQM